ncbi:MAG: DUF2203 domain-containing protein [Candidatus Peregrinibacteria bacterium]|nr:DUF2203 domain-containing protein [Candidatus Peregrinibacteria bacterium]
MHTSPPPMSSQKFFSIERAQSSLVLVRPIVKELLERHKQLVVLQNDIARMEIKLEEDESLEHVIDSNYEAMNMVLDRIAHNIEELHTIGCIFKDFQVGIVDFPTHFESRDVYLCWQFGENAIGHWHEMEGGFKGRNLINDSFQVNSSGAETILA